MRFALHRSRTFWFGLAGLVFLLWAWWDSMNYSTILMCGSWFIGQGYGAFGLTVGANLGPVSVDRSFYGPLVSGMTWFPEYQFTVLDPDPVHVILPHWIAIAVYVSLWAVLFGVRGWRYRRASKEL